MDFASSLDSVQEAALIAKPRDIFSFIIRYYQDEKEATNNSNYNIEDLHAIHLLPFLIHNHIEFQSKACTVFCNQINNNESYTKDYVDHTVVLDVLKRMNLEAFNLKVKTIDEFVHQRITGLKKVTFETFLSCLRLPISCYQIVTWLKNELLDISMLKHKKISLSPSKAPMTVGNDDTNAVKLENNRYIGFLQCKEPAIIDLEYLKGHLQRHPALQNSTKVSSNINSSSIIGDTVNMKASQYSCSYHMNPILIDNSNIVILLHLLLSITTSFLEPSINSLQKDHKSIQLKDLIEEFMKRYLQQKFPVVK